MWKAELSSLKQDLQAWERAFAHRHNRRPTPLDADAEIKEKYKKLKNLIQKTEIRPQRGKEGSGKEDVEEMFVGKRLMHKMAELDSGNSALARQESTLKFEKNEKCQEISIQNMGIRPQRGNLVSGKDGDEEKFLGKRSMDKMAPSGEDCSTMTRQESTLKIEKNEEYSEIRRQREDHKSGTEEVEQKFLDKKMMSSNALRNSEKLVLVRATAGVKDNNFIEKNEKMVIRPQLVNQKSGENEDEASFVEKRSMDTMAESDSGKPALARKDLSLEDENDASSSKVKITKKTLFVQKKKNNMTRMRQNIKSVMQKLGFGDSRLSLASAPSTFRQMEEDVSFEVIAAPSMAKRSKVVVNRVLYEPPPQQQLTPAFSDHAQSAWPSQLVTRTNDVEEEEPKRRFGLNCERTVIMADAPEHAVDDVTTLSEATNPKKAAATTITAPPATTTTSSTSFASMAGGKFRKQDNFVRLNMKKDWKQRKRGIKGASLSFRKNLKYGSRDDKAISVKPDDVVETVLDLVGNNSTTVTTTTTTITSPPPPTPPPHLSKRTPPPCGHGVLCSEFTVKKASTGNKGRKFYACALGREASCGFFLWIDDTVQAARDAFLHIDDPVKQDDEKLFVAISKMTIPELKLRLDDLDVLRSKFKSKKKSELATLLYDAWRQARDEASGLAEECFEIREASQTKQTALMKHILSTVFSHNDFLPGQYDAIHRVAIERVNTLVVQATGSGKSLVYQLPAFMQRGQTIVISPLISLMHDQKNQLPPGLMGSVLSGTQKEQAEALRDFVTTKRSKILFCAPERLFTYSFQQLASKIDVDLICVDEAHCVSSWSHNFRPAYLKLGPTIQKLFPKATVLALTATATKSVQRDVCERLNINYYDGGVSSSGTWVRENLNLIVEKAPPSEEKRLARLVAMCRSSEVIRHRDDEVDSSSSDDQDEVDFSENKKRPRLEKSKPKKIPPTIVYSTTKEDTRVIAERLQIAGLPAAAYNAGMDAGDRRRVQAEFVRGKTPIIVATVAFGMGLNKADVRRVIHYRAPRCVEDYVQEVGRAGRDGKPSTCACFFDEQGDEARRLLSLARSDGLERSQIELFVERLREHKFPELNSLNETGGIFCTAFATSLDMKEGTCETLLCSLASRGILELSTTGYGRAEISFGAAAMSSSYGSAESLSFKTARKFATSASGGANKAKVDLIQVANAIGKSVPFVVRELCIARDQGRLIQFAMIDSCWFVRRGQAWMEFLTESGIVDELWNECKALEKAACNKIRAMYDALSLGLTDQEGGGSKRFEDFVSEYLHEERGELASNDGYTLQCAPVPVTEFDECTRRAFCGDMRSLCRDQMFIGNPDVHGKLRTGRAAARIVHAVSSPAFPFETWSSHRLWGRYKQYDFDDLMQAAVEVMMGGGGRTAAVAAAAAMSGCAAAELGQGGIAALAAAAATSGRAATELGQGGS